MNPTDLKIGFLESPQKKFGCMALFTILMMVIAAIPGIGYEVATNVNPRGVIRGVGSSEGSVSTGRLCSGTLEVSFNPLLYPISYLFGRSSVLRKYQGATEFWDYQGEQVAEAATLGTILTEFIGNLPYFLAASCLITLALIKVSKYAKTRSKAMLPDAQTNALRGF